MWRYFLHVTKWDVEQRRQNLLAVFAALAWDLAIVNR